MRERRNHSHMIDSTFFVGANLKFAYSSLYQLNSLAALLDLGCTYFHPKSNLVASLLIKNIGYQFDTYYDDQRDLLPFEFIFGIKDANVNVDNNNSYKSVTNNSVHIPEIIPRTYEEGIAYLTARRNLNNMNNSTNLINLNNEEHDDDVLFDVKHYLTKLPAI